MQTVIRLRTGEEILAVADDPWTRALIGRSWSGPAWSLPGAVAYGTGTPAEPDAAITVVGTPEAAAELTRAVLADRAEPPYVLTVPRGTSLDVPHDEPEEWELKTTRHAPPHQPGEDRVTVVRGAEREIYALLAVASPGHSVRPDNPEIELWMGIRDEAGELLSAGALLRRAGTGTAYLASIATSPTMRGRGLAAAVTGRLTRTVLNRGADWCTLAHHSDNLSAHRVYERLGYRTAQRFTSVEPEIW